MFEWPSVPKDYLYLIDIASFGRWRDFPASPEGVDLLVEIRPYDADSALAAAREDEELLRTEERQTPESRALEIQRFVQLHVRSRFLLELLDTAAARGIKTEQD